jgi:O-antigen ligase
MSKTVHIFPLFFLIIGSIVSGFIYTAVAMTGLLTLIWFVISIIKSNRNGVILSYALSYLMVLYLIWLVTVTLLSYTPNTSLLTMWTLAGLPIAYLAWSITSNAEALWFRLRTTLWLGGVFLALWAIWQVNKHVGYGDAVGPLIDRNAFAALMNVFWFPAAYLFLANKNTNNNWIQLLLGTGLFIISVAMFATASRGGIATWLILLPILLWAGYRHTRSRQLVALIPLIAILAYFCSALFLHTSVADRTYQLAQDPSSNARLLLWQSALHMALAHSFSGTGWGTFASYYPAYRSPLENTTAGLYAHNDYIQLAAEGGMLALLLQLSIMLGSLFQLKRSFAQVTNAAMLESVALLLGALALFIHAGVNFIFYYAFMNILAGLYLARATQLLETAKLIKLPSLNQISSSVKAMLTGFILMLLAAPLLIHLTAQLCLTGSQPGLKVLNVIAPKINAYDIAKLITAIRPQEGIAQEIMLQASENAIAESGDIEMKGGNFQRELINETLERFDLVRSQYNNNPYIGVREAKLLIKYHATLNDDMAYAKARQILNKNLDADPYNADSMIELARLQVAENHPSDAIYTLQRATHHILSRRDHQLIDVEILRQIVAPQQIAELDAIEKQLRNVHSDSETGKPLILAPHFSEDIDARLKAIAKGLNVVPK